MELSLSVMYVQRLPLRAHERHALCTDLVRKMVHVLEDGNGQHLLA